MRKKFLSSLLVILLVILVAAAFVYFYVQINRLDKKIIANRATTAKDAAQIGQIVNFLNANTSVAPTASASVAPQTDDETNKK